MQCKDKVAIVTGAAGQGIGRSTALTLAREGAKVVVNYRSSEASAQAIVAHIEGQGGAALAVGADVQEPDGCRTLVETATGHFGSVDICIVSPGGGWHMEPLAGLDAASALDDVQKELAPRYHLMPLVLPGMYERNWGRVIAISLEPSYGSPAYAYNVAKAARSQALLLGCDEAWQHGVTMNVIGPGPVPALSSLAEAAELCAHQAAWQDRRTVTPQDIAESVAFLCSEAGRYITGCMIPFRGG